MNEFVLVEFLAEGQDDLETLKVKVHALGTDYQHMDDNWEYEADNTDPTQVFHQWYRISGRISSLRASIIKLQDPFLSERMRISYISDALKDKYRT